jgi:hypothetical protein
MRVGGDGGLVDLREMGVRWVAGMLLLSSRGVGGFVGVPGGLRAEARGREVVVCLVVGFAFQWASSSIASWIESAR